MNKRNRAPRVVLLVEDDPGDQELTRRALESSSADVDLVVVSDGEEAMDYLLHREKYADASKSPCPDLILLDLNMPKLDGAQVLTQVRAHEALRAIPVVVLTTSGREEDVRRSYGIGCNSFVTKPIELDRFLSAVRELKSYWFDLVTLPDCVGV